jgi:thioredoxin reductase/SAM-dependent methyltransferase
MTSPPCQYRKFLCHDATMSANLVGMDEQWDVLVIGGGAAGLSTALLLGRARRRVVVVDAGSPRNRFAAHMHGVLGNEGVEPGELVRRGRAEVAGYGVEFRAGQVERLDETDDGAVATLAGGETVSARAAVVATGLSDELPDLPGLAEHWGTRVLHCLYCHGWEVRDQHLGVLITSQAGLHHAELIRQWSNRVTIFAGGLAALDEAVETRLRSRGVTVVPAPVVAVSGDDPGFLAVRTADGTEITVDALFTAGTPRPHDRFLEHLGLDRADTPFGSFLAVDPTGRTSSDRIWAVGNVVNPGANVPMSIGAGAMAGGAVNAALVTREFDAAVDAANTGDWPEVAPADFWEDRYAGTDRSWSGRPNHTLVQVAENLPPGRALDLGCGEGADAIWLAERKWSVTGLDISPTAIRRAVQAARAAELPADRIDFEVADLSTWTAEQTYDLVTASFLHSPVSLPRTEVLRHAADLVAPGGHLLIISHGAAPPWARLQAEHEHRFLTPEEELDALRLDRLDGAWSTVVAETRTRPAVGPDGEQAKLDDTVVLLRRDA